MFSLQPTCLSFKQIKGRYGPDLDSLAGGHVVGVRVDHEARLHLLVNGVDQGVAAKEIPPTVYVVLDLYGQCQEVLYSSRCTLQELSMLLLCLPLCFHQLTY